MAIRVPIMAIRVPIMAIRVLPVSLRARYLEKRVEKIAEGAHADFRLFMSAEPSPNIPIAILQASRHEPMRVYGWADRGWMAGWMDGWMDGWI